MSEHTPGPWVYSRHTDYGHEILGDRGVSVAMVSCHNDCHYTEPPNPTTGGANARLVAAAPDLLEAAKAVTREWTAFIGEDDQDGHDDAVLVGRMVFHLWTAIAKATNPHD